MDDRTVTAVLDWFDARVDLSVREAAWATWEFGHTSEDAQIDPRRAWLFVTAYRAAGGELPPDFEALLVPPIRHEMRFHIGHAKQQAALEDQESARYATAPTRAFLSTDDFDSLKDE